MASVRTLCNLCAVNRNWAHWMHNPAYLSSSLIELFPMGAVAAELQVPGDPALLLPAERDHIGRSVSKRVQEFTAGRLCARRALQEFGIVDFAIRVAADRQPLWPAHMCGSITHTTGFCAAVVAQRNSLLSVGIDSEVQGQVKPDVWSTICLPLELAWLGSLPPPDRGAAATLIFSAKEAFYKCQYPLIRRTMGFHEVNIEPREWGARLGSFGVCETRSIELSTRVLLPMGGSYVFHDDYVTTGIGLIATDEKPQ